MRMKLLGFLALLSLPGMTWGGCRVIQRRAVNNRVAVKKAAVVKQAFNVTTVDVAFFAVPVISVARTYSSVYDPGAEGLSYVPKTAGYRPGSAASAPGSDLKLVLDKLNSIEQRLNTLEGKPPAPVPVPAPAKAPKPKTNLRTALTRCAGCHEAKTAETKGGKLVLFEGDLLSKTLPADIGKKVYSQVRQNKMPKQGKLLDGEAQAVVDLFMGIKEDE